MNIEILDGLEALPFLSMNELEENLLIHKNHLGLKDCQVIWNTAASLQRIDAFAEIKIKLDPRVTSSINLSRGISREKIEFIIMKSHDDKFYIIEKEPGSIYRKGPVPVKDIYSVYLPLFSYFSIFKKEKINMYP